MSHLLLPHALPPLASHLSITLHQEERREQVNEMRRLADLSGRKADAMLARRKRREKGQVLRAWQHLHERRKNRTRSAGGDKVEGAGTGRGRRTSSRSSGGGSSSNNSESDETSRGGSSSYSGSPSSSGSTGSPRSGAASSASNISSSFASSLSTNEGLNSASSSSSVSPPSFPVPSAAEAKAAGRANFSACFRAEMARAQMMRRREERAGVLDGRKGAANMAPVEIANEAVRKAMRGGGSSNRTGMMGARSLTTHEMRALACFEWHRKTHEAKITRVVYGSI